MSAIAIAPDPRVAAAWRALATVVDPELPALTIVELGVVRAVDAAGDRVEVALTPTYTACPATIVIRDAAAQAIEAAGLGRPLIRIVHAPAWTTDWLGPEARAKLAAAGIAPPSRAAPACPRCGATVTERLSEFGSTPCKALWRCTACREPFELFKCH